MSEVVAFFAFGILLCYATAAAITVSLWLVLGGMELIKWMVKR